MEEIMQVIGITGGAGAGKSAVLEYLEKNYRVKNLEADKIAQMMMRPGTDCYQKLLKFLPAEVYNQDETISRLALSAELFASEELRNKVNQAVHPAVKEYILSQLPGNLRRALVYLCHRGNPQTESDAG